MALVAGLLALPDDGGPVRVALTDAEAWRARAVLTEAELAKVRRDTERLTLRFLFQLTREQEKSIALAQQVRHLERCVELLEAEIAELKGGGA